MGEQDWRAAIDDLDAALLDGYQSGFPVEARPFRAVGEALGVSEATAFERVRSLRERGLVRRFGAVLNPPVIGSSTLAALSVPADEFDAVAEFVNGYRQVNHNYRRDHEWNMWFVVTAGSRDRRDAILAEIGAETGLDVLNLPMRTDYYIDLEFPVVNDDRFAGEATAPTAGVATANGDGAEAADGPARPTRVGDDPVRNLSDLERRLLLAIQEGFPLSATPYADLAGRLETATDEVLGAIESLLADRCIKRVGCIVNHVRVGFDSNCMVVWDVPDEDLDAAGVAAGNRPYVTLCYHRPRRPEQDWPYTLFTMIHGREAAAVEAKIDELAGEVLPYDHERLHSLATLKQTGARYDDLVTTTRPLDGG